MKIKTIKNCRNCKSSNIIEIISFGDQYVSNFVKSEEEQGIKVPLDLVLCENCKLLQLRHSAPSELMWGDQYWYKSGISSIIKNDLKDIVNQSKKIVNLKEKDIIVDIGCNDGTMLEFYDKGILVGFEPAKNVAEEAKQKGFKVINNFFNAQDFKEKFPNKKAKLITAISMFYDLEDPNKFLQDIVSVLDEKGIFVMQQNYLVSMLKQNAFDNICHEHKEYYSFQSLKNLLDKHGLEIFDVYLNDINGGSIRTYIKLRDNKEIKLLEGAEKRLSEVEEKEAKIGLDTLKPYKDFASRVNSIKNELVSFLKKEKAKGKTICIVGASTRGNVSLQFFDLGPDIIHSIADANPDKWGKKTIGTLIPIHSPEEIRKINPDYLLVMIWHLFEQIKENEKEYFEKGGKFILPLPKFRIISKD